MMTLQANPRTSRQLSLEGPMLLWRHKAGGGREGLLLTTEVCENLRCTIRHVGLHALWVEEGLISASLRRTTITTKSLPGTNAVARSAFFLSLGLDDSAVEPQEGHTTDPVAVAWLKAELDTELRAVLLARFEGERRLIRERASAEAATRAVIVTPPLSRISAPAKTAGAPPPRMPIPAPVAPPPAVDPGELGATLAEPLGPGQLL
jgi:hypothetical protein